MITYRWLDAGDLAAWRDLRSEALRLEPEAFLTTVSEFEARPDDAVAAQLAQGKTLGAWDGERLVGSIAYMRKSHEAARHRAALAAVYTRPAYRGSGASRGMMAAVELRAAKDGVDQLELWVWDGNQRAIAFYERHGFERTGRLPRAVVVDGVERDDLFYIRALRR